MWTRGRRFSRDLSRIGTTPGKGEPRQRQPVNEEKLRSVYRRGNALLFEMAIYTIHFDSELLLIDTARPEAESIFSPSQKSATARGVRAVIPGPEVAFPSSSTAGEEDQRARGEQFSQFV